MGERLIVPPITDDGQKLRFGCFNSMSKEVRIQNNRLLPHKPITKGRKIKYKNEKDNYDTYWKFLWRCQSWRQKTKIIDKKNKKLLD